MQLGSEGLIRMCLNRQGSSYTQHFEQICQFTSLCFFGEILAVLFAEKRFRILLNQVTYWECLALIIPMLNDLTICSIYRDHTRPIRMIAHPELCEWKILKLDIWITLNIKSLAFRLSMLLMNPPNDTISTLLSPGVVLCLASKCEHFNYCGF